MTATVIVTMTYEVTDPAALQAASEAACKDMNLGDGETGAPCLNGWVHWCIAKAGCIEVPGTDLLEHRAELGEAP